MTGRLYVVGTPIGNLSDISPRAVQTLTDCDFIAAEDTRVTLKLLNHFEIKKSMVSYYEHNRRERGEMILSRILAGESCALVTDAGMPAISDPGEDLVALCHQNGVKVTVVPGPCAFVSALAMSGMSAGRFTFEGFLSVNKKSRLKHLNEIKDEKRTLIFYEAPHKLKNTLTDLYDALGDRNISIVREITKIHEEVIHTSLKESIELYKNENPKGEIVLIIEGRKDSEEIRQTLEDALSMANMLIEGGESVSYAAKEAAGATGIKKNEIYAALCKENRGAE